MKVEKELAVKYSSKSLTLGCEEAPPAVLTQVGLCLVLNLSSFTSEEVSIYRFSEFQQNCLSRWHGAGILTLNEILWV